ncbi:MAG TPA: hypothetical protein VGX91_10315 [Candidatus Cybelea sp.]|jgi:photosystem II stability/assembly factor-like uncharacterized protein|nr:hypothetical protein [Candidatus Cybelea sp.]
MHLLALIVAAVLVNPAYFDSLHWRLIGPFRGGRAIAVTGVPGQPNHFYFGAVDGGVWESPDAGRTWTPIFDKQDVGSIGAIAVAPSDPSTIYVGTGEADMRSDIAYGDGMYKSTDAGKTWSHIGLENTKQIGAIAIDPHDANVVYVAALGHPYAANADRGVFKTTDGGRTWSKVLYKNADTGAISLAMEPANPNVIYAALWQTRRPPWNVYPPSNGPGSGLYKSSDGGTTWTQLTNGLPARVGKIGLSISAAAPNRVYANVDSPPSGGGVYRSDDAGATWHRMDGEGRIWQRGWYFSGITADPRNPDVVYVMDTATYRSIDGGKTFDALLGDPTGDDFHTLWIDPADSTHMILGSDQGVVVTVDGAHTWSSWYNQPTAQFYHVATDNAFPYSAYGAQQDSGADVQTTRSKYGAISQQDFRPLDVGGENGMLAPDPRHPGVVYGDSSGQGGPTVTREVPATGEEQNLDPALTHTDTVWRNTWTLPLTFSPADHTSLYFAHQNVFRSRNGGATWSLLSPDLSRPNEGTPSNLDAPTLADDNNVTRHGVVYTIAPSPLAASLLWAGTDDGYVWVTQNATTNAPPARWRNVTPPGLSAWSKVGTIEASHFDTATAYAAIDRHRIDDYAPYIYRTHDGGTTWTQISSGIPNGSFVNVVREDPVVRGLLYAGTEKGVYVSFDDGNAWQPLQLNLPVTSIRDIAVHGDDLVVATHGRAFWVLDDVAPLRQARAAGGGGPYLYAPAPAYRIQDGNEEGTPLPLDEPQSADAPTGLYIDYYLPHAASTPVVIEIADASGVVRRYSSAQPPKTADPKDVDFTPYWIAKHPVPATSAGAHRFVWDFRRDGHTILMPPGTYTIRLIADGQTSTQQARVLRDPRVPASEADLRAQYVLATQVAALLSEVHASRAKAQDLAKRLSGAQAQALRSEVIGEAMPSNPDDSMGAYSHDVSSFLFLENELDYLGSAIESADAAPTPDMRTAYDRLAAKYQATLARLHSLSP